MCAKQEREVDNASKQYSAEKMQMRSQSLQPATWATLTVAAATAYGNVKWGAFRSKTFHLNIQMLPPNNIMRYGF